MPDQRVPVPLPVPETAALVLAVGTEAHEIRVMDASSMKWEAELEGHEEAITCLAFDPKGKVLTSTAADRTVRIWSPSKAKVLHVLSGARRRRPPSPSIRRESTR